MMVFFASDDEDGPVIHEKAVRRIGTDFVILEGELGRRPRWYSDAGYFLTWEAARGWLFHMAHGHVTFAEGQLARAKRNQKKVEDMEKTS